MTRRSASPSTVTTPADGGAPRFPAGDYRRPGEAAGEPKSPELEAFLELIDREAHRQRLLRETRRNPPPWQPSFEMEDFGSPPASALSEKLAAGGGKKREREVRPLAGGGAGEEVQRKKKMVAAMAAMKWDLNKRDECFDDN